MLPHPVRFKVAVQFGEGPGEIGLLAGPRHAAFRIADDRLLAVDDVRERPQREQDRCRVAAGIGDQPRVLQLAVAPLREPVDGLLEQRRPRVRKAVPARIQGRIVEAEGAGEIDHAHAAVEQLRRELGRDFVRRGQEDDFRIPGRQRFEVERLGWSSFFGSGRKRWCLYGG